MSYSRDDRAGDIGELVESIKKAQMKLFNWTNTRLVLMIGILIFFSFTSARNENRKLTKSVLFLGDNALL
jgi:hypothetical protein